MDVEISIEELRKRKILVCTPMYGGAAGGQFTHSCAKLAQLATHYGVQIDFNFLFNESLIPRARNYLADEFLRSEYTHMMFIDADIGFDPNDVLSLAAIAEEGSEYEIVTAAYPKKMISWEKIKMAVDKGFADQNPNVLERFVGDYVFNPSEGQTEIALDEPVEVLEGGTGFMMIQRSAFDKFKEAYKDELSYLPDHARTAHFDGSREIIAYFDCVIDPKTKRYLSEDYMFCQYARRAGIKIWLCPWMQLSHMGTYIFGGSLVDLAQIGASATVDLGSIKKGK